MPSPADGTNSAISLTLTGDGIGQGYLNPGYVTISIVGGVAEHGVSPAESMLTRV